MPPVSGRRSLHSGIYDYSNGHFLSEKDTIDTILLSDNGKDLKWLRREARCFREAWHDDDYYSLVRLIAFSWLKQELKRLRDLEKRLIR
ncbi:hypothetical protein ACHAPD_008664 [Fusarium lateritium]